MIGATLLNRYKIESELGKGGMGIVYKAYDTLLNRAVAIKFLNTSDINTEGKSRLLKEAQAAAQLNHPNIVSIYDAGEADNLAFIVMEIVKGETLRKIESLNLLDALLMAQQICLALEHAHSNGIIHRDLKLENIIITNSQTLKLMDFGLAHGVNDVRMTEEGMLTGTLAYLAPELIQGKPASVQSDLYAFGVILYELLIGHAPFEGTVSTVLAQHIHGKVTPPSEHNASIPEWMDELVLRLLSKRPEERPASAKEVLLIIEDNSAPPTKATLVSIVPRPKNNLPAQLTTFIGREKEVEQIKRRLEKSRLVTLTGSGGIGKTRLSIQVASELLNDYPIGVWLVELAPVTDPALVPQSVCVALGVTPEGSISALDALIDYLRAKKILLVVDNCEHLIDACAQLCDSLLHACDDLRIIASSREALGIEGENAYRVPSLSLPDPKSGLPTIEESEAVKLFMERATALLPEFEMTEANAPAIAQICQRLDGIALAIELAASRVKMLKVEQIATRLDDAFRLLTGGNRTALPRQQTLRALIDWSYNLLSDNEKVFLRRLSIFMGGWTLEAAEAICGNADALDLLTHLVDKSLVSVDLEHGDEPRYYLLETVRQYAREKLFESGEGEKIRDQHLKVILELAEKAEPEIRSANQLIWLDRLDEEIDNLRAALEWSQERDKELFLRLASALWRFWDVRGYIEDMEWLPKALTLTEGLQAVTRARALLRAYWVGDIFSDSHRMETWLQEALLLSRELNDRFSLAWALSFQARQELLHENSTSGLALLNESLSLSKEINDHWLIGVTQFYFSDEALFLRNDLKSVRFFLEEGLKEFRLAGDKRSISSILNRLSYIALAQGDAKEALTFAQASLVCAQEIGDKNNIVGCYERLVNIALFLEDFPGAEEHALQGYKAAQILNMKSAICRSIMNLGWIARAQGNILRFAEQMEEALAIAIQINDPNLTVDAVYFLGEASRLNGDFIQAKSRFVEALTNCQEELSVFFFCLSSFGMLATDQGQSERGARLLSAWEILRATVFLENFHPFQVHECESHIAKAREQLGEENFNKAWAEGAAMSTEVAVKYALEESSK